MSEGGDSGSLDQAGDNVGVDHLSDKEVYYLRAAGIPPHMLNSMDRAAVVRALMVDYYLIEDGAAGGFAALTYKTGALRDMLVRTAEDEREEEVGMDGLTPKEREDLLKKKKAERARQIEEKVRIEQQEFETMGPQAYQQANPIPAEMLYGIMIGGLGFSAAIHQRDNSTEMLSQNPDHAAQLTQTSPSPVIDPGLAGIFQKMRESITDVDLDPTELKAPLKQFAVAHEGPNMAALMEFHKKHKND